MTSSFPQLAVDRRLVDDYNAVAELIDDLLQSPSSSTGQPQLYVDIEGVKLSRDGTISIVQILSLAKSTVYLVDVHVLGALAFSIPGSSGMTLKHVLESESIQKAFFDIRHDSDALFGLFGVRVAGIQDIQLMELATRRSRKNYVSGLSRCIENDLQLTLQEQKVWKDTKQRGLDLFEPGRGGSYELFNERPMRPEIFNYCAQDVMYLPKLWSVYANRMTSTWKPRVLAAIKDRIVSSQLAVYNGTGKHMALAPKGWA